MVASENGALPGGKAGGVGDVLRDLPRALALRGHAVTVITPGYGALHETPGMRPDGTLAVNFAGAVQSVNVFARTDQYNVTHVVLDHALLTPGAVGQIYHDDGSDRPFATDAGKFALLSVSAAQWLLDNADDKPVIHLHDWHAAWVLMLRELDPAFAAMREWRMVLTLHNLALQGIRPRRHDPSSFEQWFGHIQDPDALLGDPRYADCVNPIAAGIRLADAINTVSPTNAREILQPNDPSRSFRGGEGLEHLLRAANDKGALHGILNGCAYDTDKSRVSWKTLHRVAMQTIEDWQANQPQYVGIHALALGSLARLRDDPDMIITSVGRLTDQKLGLLLHRGDDGQTTLARLLATLPERAVMLLLGSGDSGIEQELVQHALNDPRLVFIRGFSEALADCCYRAGQLFLMPSTFEPCGISQMLAMRAGQPCLVHAVGGLNDTVRHLTTGFRFTGESVASQSTNCVSALRLAQRVFFDEPDRWHTICESAASKRFEWATSAQHYERAMYAFS